MAEETLGQAAQVGGTVPEPIVADVAPTTSRREKGKSKKKIWIIIAVVVVLLLAVGGWFIFSSPGSETDENTTEQVTPTRAPTNTPTPSEEIQKADISIQVLNGTGIAGEATFIQGELEAVGYTDVEADNADTKDAVDTTVTFVEGVSSEVQDEIVEILEESYDEVVIKTASSLGGFDVKILLGYRVDYTPTPTEGGSTPTPTGEVTPTEGETTPTTTSTPTPTETE